MATMREEMYDKLRPLLEKVVDIACDHIEELERYGLPELEYFNMDIVKARGFSVVLGYLEEW